MSWDLAALFRRHAAEISRSLRRRGLPPDVAADLTQDTFLRVLAAPPPATDSARHNPRAYLFQVSRSIGINHQRRERLAPQTGLTAEVLAAQPDSAPSTERHLIAREELDRIALALTELPERTRHAFIRHRLDQRRIAEIADEIDLSVSRTWALIHEAYRHILTRTDPL